jgi:hypothetical protein
VATPAAAVRIEDVTEAHLGGVASQASRFERVAFRAAFRVACLDDILGAQVEQWTALGVIWDAGTWREVVAEGRWPQWTIARRWTAEERRP